MLSRGSLALAELVRLVGLRVGILLNGQPSQEAL